MRGIVGSAPDEPRTDNPSAEPVRTKQDAWVKLAVLEGRASLQFALVVSSYGKEDVEPRESFGFCNRDIAYK